MTRRIPTTPAAAEALVRETSQLLQRPSLRGTRAWRVTKRHEGAVARRDSLTVGRL